VKGAIAAGKPQGSRPRVERGAARKARCAMEMPFPLSFSYPIFRHTGQAARLAEWASLCDLLPASVTRSQQPL